MSMILPWFLMAFFAAGALASIISVGKSREPMTGGTAAIIVVTDAAIIVWIVLGWPR